MRLLYLYLLCYSSLSFALDVEWIVLDFPPYYIVSGKDIGQGRDEALIELITKTTPELNATYMRVPVSRAIYQLKDRDKLRCVISLYKTASRSEFVLFSSNHSTIGLPITLALTKRTANKLGLTNAKSTSLANLLVKDHSLMVGFTENRAFGQSIDQILANTDDSQKESRPGLDALFSLTNMLIKDRVSFVLGYASEHFYTKQALDSHDELTQIAIDETPDHIFGYIGCSMHSDAPKLLALLDKQLSALHLTNSYQEIMLRWLPENLKPRLVQYLPLPALHIE